MRTKGVVRQSVDGDVEQIAGRDIHNYFEPKLRGGVHNDVFERAKIRGHCLQISATCGGSVEEILDRASAYSEWVFERRASGKLPLLPAASKKQGSSDLNRIARMETMIDAAIRGGVVPPHMRGHLVGYASFGEAELAGYIGELADAKTEFANSGGA